MLKRVQHDEWWEGVVVAVWNHIFNLAPARFL